MPETPPAPQFWQSKMSWDIAKCFFGGGKITPIENYCFKIRFYNSPKESLMACFSSFSGFSFHFLSSYLSMKGTMNCAFWLVAGGCRILNFHARLIQHGDSCRAEGTPWFCRCAVCPGRLGWIYSSESVLWILKMYPLIFDSENPLTLGGDTKGLLCDRRGEGCLDC